MIIWGHPGIGKTYAREMRNDLLDFDEDYKARINGAFNLPLGFQARNKWRSDNPELWNTLIQGYWAEAVKESQTTGKHLLVSDMMMLRLFSHDLDLIINISVETFIERCKLRNDLNDGSMSWKANIDSALIGLESKTVITDKFMSNYLISIF